MVLLLMPTLAVFICASSFSRLTALESFAENGEHFCPAFTGVHP